DLAARAYDSGHPTAHFAMAAIEARWAMERGKWTEAAAIDPRPNRFPHTESIIYFARAIGAARSGDAARARGDVDRLAALKDLMKDARHRRVRRQPAPRASGSESVPVIASARMYAWSPSLAAAWQRLLEWIARAAGVELAVIDQSTPTNLDELWARQDMGCVFMCGYPWALRRDRPALLAAPVPSPLRYGDRAAYVTDFIVSAAGPHRTLEDTFGGVIAYSTEHSHSGYNAPRHHLLKHVSPA